MQKEDIIPNLFRAEYRKIIAVLCSQFGFEQIEIAEDIASQTFLTAAETWGIKGLPENPAAWLYTVAKNKAKDVLKREDIFHEKISPQIKLSSQQSSTFEIDLSDQNIRDSQLQMIFAVCHPCISAGAQIGLALRILCGFGIDEIANAFLSNKETIAKRLGRAKDKLKEENVKIEVPSAKELLKRLDNVLTTLYLLFNEGYYSAIQNKILRKELCLEAMRLTKLLTENKYTDRPETNALLSLMCFHASRFEARTNDEGVMILYEDQNENLWSPELIMQGKFFLNVAAKGSVLSRFHIEAAIAYHHTNKEDTKEKWEAILQLYNQLLIQQYSSSAALNRAYAISKARSKKEAIEEAEKLNLKSNHLYFSLLGNLYTSIDDKKALQHFNHALLLARSIADKKIILENINKLR